MKSRGENCIVLTSEVLDYEGDHWVEFLRQIEADLQRDQTSVPKIVIACLPMDD